MKNIIILLIFSMLSISTFTYIFILDRDSTYREYSKGIVELKMGDCNKAISILEPLAISGYTDAQYSLAYCYILCEEIDREKAIFWFRRYFGERCHDDTCIIDDILFTVGRDFIERSKNIKEGLYWICRAKNQVHKEHMISLLSMMNILKYVNNNS